MIDIDNLLKYYESNKAFYLYFLREIYNYKDIENYMNNHDYLIGAKVGSIVNTLLAIKESVIENIGNLQFDSIIKKENLNKSVLFISKFNNNKYYIDGLEFDSPESIVSTIRNKLGHGYYEIDFNNNKLIIDIDNNKINIDIDKLSCMVINLLGKTYKEKKVKEESRFLPMYKLKKDSKLLSTRSDLYNTIKKSNVVKITINKDDSDYIEKFILNKYYEYINILKNNDIDFNIVKNMKEYFKQYGYTINVEYLSIKNSDCINNIANNLEYTILNECKSIEEQIIIILIEVEKVFNDKKKDILDANLGNLIILDNIEKYNIYNIRNLVDKISEEYNLPFTIHNYNVGVVLINMFTSSFIVPYDHYYKGNDTDINFDFSKLDLSSIEVLEINNDDILFRSIKEEINSINNSLEKINISINNTKNNYSSLLNKNNDKALSIVSNNLNNLNITKSKLLNRLYILKEDLYNKEHSYIDNNIYLRNRSIIEGIRNSISHGNIEVLLEDKPYLLFNNIYEGKLVGSFKVDFNSFSKICDNSIEVLIDYLKEYTRV